MAVVATLSKGYDLDYIWKHVDRGPAKDAASYYIQASESGGEPPGRWWGPGAKALGFDYGQRVDREPYDLLFGKRQAPDGTRLGRPPASGRKAAEVYKALLAAEPHATAERQGELRTEAAQKARQGPLFFDLTLSLSKSISLFHASLGENARLARQAGDNDGDEYWSALVAEVDEMIWQAVHAGFGYLQKEAGYTRTGSHNTRVHGRETGQWHEADLAVAHWLQHISRDGDMQLHVHSQIAHVAKTGTDGKWRAPDSLGYNEHVGAVAAIVSQHLEEALTRRFGVEWVARDDGHGFEIKGISGQMMRLFSSRRESITADLRTRAARFEQRYGRKPSQREMAQLAQASNFSTRAAKDGALDFAQLHAGWADKLARTLGVPLASVAPSVWHNTRGRATAPTHDPGGPVLTELELARAAQKAVVLAQQEKSVWTRADVIKYLGRVLPRSGIEPAAAAVLLEGLADRALRSEFESVFCLEGPEPVEVPCSLLRADGRSIYQRHGGVRYATGAQLAMEERMLAQASASGAPRLTRAQAARALGADPAQLEAALAGRAHATHDERTQTGLREDQAAMIRFALDELSRENGHHAFEHLCRELAQARIASNILPATGPVAAGGDQGRDFETFRTYLAGSLRFSRGFLGLASAETVVFACTLQREDLKAKVKDDVTSICTQGTPVQMIYFLCTEPVTVSVRHDLQAWASGKYQVTLEVIDGRAIARLLADHEVFWIARTYLHMPAELSPAPPPSGPEMPGWYARLRDDWANGDRAVRNFAEMMQVVEGLRHATDTRDARMDLGDWLRLMDAFISDIAVADTVQRARYEVARATLRGTGDLRPAEHHVRAFFADVPSLTAPNDLRDAGVLLHYLEAASRNGESSVGTAELKGWATDLRGHVTSLLDDATSPGRRAGLLHATAYLSLRIDMDAIEQHAGRPAPPAEPRHHMAPDDLPDIEFPHWLPLVDIDHAMTSLLELVELLPRAPLFPISSLARYFDMVTPALVDHPLYPPVRSGLDEATSRQAGEASTASRCRKRAMALYKSGKRLAVLRELHEAKVNWWHGDTVRHSVLAMLYIAHIYSELMLPHAAKEICPGRRVRRAPCA